jgi:hypothetical protein
VAQSRRAVTQQRRPGGGSPPNRGGGARRPSGGGGGGGGRRPSSGGGRAPIVVLVSVVVVLAVVAILLVNALGGSSKAAASSSPAPADVVSKATHVPKSVLESIGVSTAGVTPPAPVDNKSVPELTSGGKPEMFYEGAEFCPFCAAERWAMVVALSHFGTFKNLRITESAAGDVYPRTHTFSFYHSSYTSPYLTFVPVETNTNQLVNGTYPVLQVPTKAEDKIFDEFEKYPYLPKGSQPSIPFVDIANRYIVIGAQYDPQVLQGLTWGSIAGSLSIASSTPAKDIGAASNYLTAAICQVTHDKPSSVCSAPFVKTALENIAKAAAAAKKVPSNASKVGS